MGKHFILALFISLLLTLPAVAVDQHYSLDDGSSDLALGGVPGDVAWIQHFEPVGGSETITHISTAFGSSNSPGFLPDPGTGVTVYIWDDPNNDGDPSDAVLLGSGSGELRFMAPDIFDYYALWEPVTVTSSFFVGAMIRCISPSHYPRPLDQSLFSNGRAWAVGDSGNFNADDLTDNSYPPVDQDTTPNPGVWLLRAHRFASDVFCDSFDRYAGTTNLTWWTEEIGQWSIADKRLVSEASAVNQVATVDGIEQADGCVQVQGHYGDGVGLRYFGTVVRYTSDTDRILVKLQENGTNGYFNACYAYDGGTVVYSLQGQNYGAEPVLQVEYVGTQIMVRVDVDNDGGWEHEYPVTVTTTQSGRFGAGAYNRCSMDNWCSGPSPDAWGGTVIDFQGVPETYWLFGGGVDLGGVYPGLTFGPGIGIIEETVHGYFDEAYPWHSFDAVIGSEVSAERRVDFDEPKTHVGIWFTASSGDGFAEAFDESGTIVDSAPMSNNLYRNDYISLDGDGIRYVIFRNSIPTTITLDDLEYRPANSPADTIEASFDCSPTMGVLPFQVSMNVELFNFTDQTSRRIAGRINIRLANNTSYSNWRTGATNVGPLGSYSASWMQYLPALGSLVGTNNFTLVAEDITPAPYNQPPYPASGDAAVKACLITASAP